MKQIFSFTATNASAEEAGKEVSQKTNQFIVDMKSKSDSFEVLTATPMMVCTGSMMITIYTILLIVEVRELIAEEEHIKQNVEDFLESRQEEENHPRPGIDRFIESNDRLQRKPATYEQLVEAFGPMDED